MCKANFVKHWPPSDIMTEQVTEKMPVEKTSGFTG